MSVLERKLFSRGGAVRGYSNGGAVFYGVGRDRSVEEVANAITPVHGNRQRDIASGMMVPTDGSIAEAQARLRDIETAPATQGFDIPGVHSSSDIVGYSGEEGVSTPEDYSTIGTGIQYDDDYGQGDIAEFPYGRFRDQEGGLLGSGVMSLLDDEGDPETEAIIDAPNVAPGEEVKSLYAEEDPGDLSYLLGQQIHEQSGGTIPAEDAEEVIAEESKKYRALGGDPSTFLLDFGLALMASKSPYFMTAVGEAGLVARKSAKERLKDRRAEKKLKLEEKKLEAEIADLEGGGKHKRALLASGHWEPASIDAYWASGDSIHTRDSSLLQRKTKSTDYTTKTMSYPHPETGKRVIGQVRIGADGSMAVVGPKGEVKYGVEPEGVVAIGMQTPVGVDETGFTKPQQKARMELDQKFDGTVQFLGSAMEYRALFDKTDYVQQPILREGLISLEGLKQGVSTLARSLGYGRGDKVLTDDLAKKLENPAYLDEYFGDFDNLSPEMQSYAERLGGWEAFKARGLSLAISLAAADGATGKALSDKDMQQYLTQIGMGVQTKEGFTQTLDSLIQKKKDDYIVSLMGFHRSTLPRDEYNRLNYTTNYQDSGKGFWEYEFSQPTYKDLYGGRLYSIRSGAPKQTTLPGGSSGGNPFDTFAR